LNAAFLLEGELPAAHIPTSASDTSAEIDDPGVAENFAQLPLSGALVEGLDITDPVNTTSTQPSAPTTPIDYDSSPAPPADQRRQYIKKPTLPRSLLYPDITTRTGRLVKPPTKFLDDIRVRFDPVEQIRYIPPRPSWCKRER